MRVVFVGAGNLATRLSLEMRKSGMSIGYRLFESFFFLIVKRFDFFV